MLNVKNYDLLGCKCTRAEWGEDKANTWLLLAFLADICSWVLLFFSFHYLLDFFAIFNDHSIYLRFVITNKKRLLIHLIIAKVLETVLFFGFGTNHMGGIICFIAVRTFFCHLISHFFTYLKFPFGFFNIFDDLINSIYEL